MAMLNNQMVKHLVISCDSKNKTMKKTWKKKHENYRIWFRKPLPSGKHTKSYRKRP